MKMKNLLLTGIAICSLFAAIDSAQGYSVTNYTANFVLASSPVVGSAPYSIAAMDVNGDGKMDLISADEGSHTLTVLTNGGNGIFGSNVTYALPVTPVFVVAADVNGDSKTDLVYSSSDNNTLTVFTNNGSGIFKSNATYSVDSAPYNFAAADVNADGKVDLISADYSSADVTVFTNNGSGKFASSGVFSTGNAYSRWVAVGDLNGDGKPDLVVADYTTFNLYVFTNVSKGIFQLASTVASGAGPFAVTMADLNGDGKLDLITSGAGYGNGGSGNVVTVYTNNGNGTFTSAVNYNVGANPISVAAADVNRDGKLDLITANSGDNTLTILTNNGNGTFTLAATPPVGAGPVFVTAMDVNGDGNMDLICANSGTNTLTVLTNAPAIVYPLQINSFSPTGGVVGTSVTINGPNNFSTVTNVLFNGQSAAFSINSDSQITATVPQCALTGPITVINSSATATSATNFSYIKQQGTITLTSTDEASLDGAICDEHSNVTFAVDGTITITTTKAIFSDMVFDGTGHSITINGNNSVGIFNVNPGVHLTLKNLTIANGRTTSGGGGIYNNGGIVTVINCTFSNNTATGSSGGNTGAGGGICDVGGTAIIVGSTFVSNSATGGIGSTGTQGASQYAAGGTGGIGGNGIGGAVCNAGSGNMFITNCTFFGNVSIGGNGGIGGQGYNGYSYQYVCGSYRCGFNTCYDYCEAYVYGGPGGQGGAGGNAYGGNIYNSQGNVIMVNVTFAGGSVLGGSGGSPGNAGNLGSGSYGSGSSGGGSGGNIGQGIGQLVFLNTIVANPVQGGNYWGGAITDAGNNLSSDATLAFINATSFTNTNPNLGLLANNDGPTLTMALLPASPAVRAGTTNGAPTIDQRGQPRKALQIDIGAYETPVIAASSFNSKLGGIETSGKGPFQLSFTNTAGTSFSIWYNTNLSFNNWTFIGFAHEVTPGQFLYNDPGITNNPQGFYRVSSP